MEKLLVDVVALGQSFLRLLPTPPPPHVIIIPPSLHTNISVICHRRYKILVTCSVVKHTTLTYISRLPTQYLQTSRWPEPWFVEPAKQICVRHKPTRRPTIDTKQHTTHAYSTHASNGNMSFCLLLLETRHQDVTLTVNFMFPKTEISKTKTTTEIPTVSTPDWTILCWNHVQIFSRFCGLKCQ